MEDKQIIDLYFARDEQAIRETESKYGAFCLRIAMNLLRLREDAEECVNDTYGAAWNSMPPQRPNVLPSFLGRITRNISISRFRANRAAKRYQGMETMLSELSDCVPDVKNGEETDGVLLADTISRWLDRLPGDDCALFVRRYWYGDGLAELGQKYGSRERAAKRLFILRRGLKEHLEKEGIVL